MIPLYLFTGFLDAGKTSFVQETMADPRFSSGEKTFLLLCEEGEEEYDPKKFAGGENVTIVTISDQSEMTAEYLRNLTAKYHSDRVVLEYNGMWPMSAFDPPTPRPAQGRYQDIRPARRRSCCPVHANAEEGAGDGILPHDGRIPKRGVIAPMGRPSFLHLFWRKCSRQLR